MTDAASLREALAPRLDADSGRAAARDVRDAPAIAFLVDDHAWRFVPGGETIRIERGDDAPTVVALDAAGWHDFATERATGAGLLYGGRVRFERGGQAELERWEPALRALFDGRPIFVPAAGVVGATDCAWRGTQRRGVGHAVSSTRRHGFRRTRQRGS